MARESRGLAERLRAFPELGMVVVIVIAAVIFTSLDPKFASIRNVANIASQISFLAVLAVSMTYVIISGEIDLSIGSMVGLCSVVFGLLCQHGVDIGLAIPLTMLAGIGLGIVNGLLSVVLRVPTIIITLGTLSAYRGAAYYLSDGYPISGFARDSFFFAIGQQRLWGIIPYNALILVVFAVVAALVLRHTVFGHRLYAMGSNLRAARLAGIDTDRIKVQVLAFSGFSAAVAALLTTSQTAVADPNVGTGYELDAIAAVIIGGAQLTGGVGTILGSVLGMLLIGMIRNGLVIVGVSIYLLIVVSGVIVIAAVAVNQFVNRRRDGGTSPARNIRGGGKTVPPTEVPPTTPSSGRTS
jgi:ribose/xylose/arabinose/galactoside ABC-type transport system permease subunit